MKMSASTRNDARMQKAGGAAALYLAFALLAAMPYFLIVVDYPSATTVTARVALILENYGSMYAMYLATYVAFGLALGVLALALHDRLKDGAPTGARLVATAGLLWAVALVASGMIFTYGMTTIVTLADGDPEQAHLAWQAIEPVALALGGAGGEVLGGLWALLVGSVAVRSHALPKALAWLGVAIGALGIASVVPPLHDAAIAFGLLLIVWLGWLGGTLLGARTPNMAGDRTLRAETA